MSQLSTSTLSKRERKSLARHFIKHGWMPVYTVTEVVHNYANHGHENVTCRTYDVRAARAWYDSQRVSHSDHEKVESITLSLIRNGEITVLKTKTHLNSEIMDYCSYQDDYEDDLDFSMDEYDQDYERDMIEQELPYDALMAEYEQRERSDFFDQLTVEQQLITHGLYEMHDSEVLDQLVIIKLEQANERLELARQEWFVVQVNALDDNGTPRSPWFNNMTLMLWMLKHEVCTCVHYAPRELEYNTIYVEPRLGVYSVDRPLTDKIYELDDQQMEDALELKRIPSKLNYYGPSTPAPTEAIMIQR